MNNKARALTTIVLLAGTLVSFQDWNTFIFPRPANFPEPVYPFKDNPLTQARFELGRALFYETALSVDNSISCGSCHIQTSAFTQHGHDLSHGVEDRLGERNSPPIMNLAWHKSYFWDGGVFHLDLQSITPITNPVEMAEEMPNVLNKLQALPKYKAMFQSAYGSADVTGERLFKALSQFMVMCVSADSKYDSVMRKQGPAFTGAEQRGYIFFKKNCSTCHAEPLFTDGSFRYNGLNNTFNPDSGRMAITLDPDDRFRFKVPSLRNLYYTAPFMHDGRFMKLEEVLEHYASGVTPAANLDPALKRYSRPGIPITTKEKADLLAFLKTLDDERFISRTDLSEQIEK